MAEQLVRMSRLKGGGRWRMWIQRLVQSESRSDCCCWSVGDGRMVRRRRSMVVVLVVHGGDLGGGMVV